MPVPFHKLILNCIDLTALNLCITYEQYLLTLVEEPAHQGKEDDVEGSKDVLSQADVCASAGQVVKAQEEIHKACKRIKM